MLAPLKKFLATTRRFLGSGEEGASAVEYGLMVAAVTALIITVVFSLGVKVKSPFITVDKGLDTAASGK